MKGVARSLPIHSFGCSNLFRKGRLRGWNARRGAHESFSTLHRCVYIFERTGQDWLRAWKVIARSEIPRHGCYAICPYTWPRPVEESVVVARGPFSWTISRLLPLFHSTKMKLFTSLSRLTAYWKLYARSFACQLNRINEIGPRIIGRDIERKSKSISPDITWKTYYIFRSVERWSRSCFVIWIGSFQRASAL